MKRSNLLALGLVVCLVSAISSAANPVTWTFTNFTSNNGSGLCGHWDSTGQNTLDNGFGAYDFTLTLTKVELSYTTMFGSDWYDATSLVNPKTFSDQLSGPLPISYETIVDQSESGINVHARLVMSVGSDGVMNLDIYEQNINGSIAIMTLTGGLRLSGTTDITGVPEPCTLALLGCGVAGLIARRRNRK